MSFKTVGNPFQNNVLARSKDDGRVGGRGYRPTGLEVGAKRTGGFL